MSLQPKSATSFRKQILDLLGESYGDKTLVLCPTAFVKLLHGDHKAAILLSQILYWSDRTQDPDGWFYKSYAMWQAETGLSETQVRRIVNGDPRVTTAQRPLRDLGVETKLKKVKSTGAPTLWYRLDREKFLGMLHRLMGQGDSTESAESIVSIARDQPQQMRGMNSQQSTASLDPKIEFKDHNKKEQDHQNPTHDDEDLDLALFFPFEARFGKLKRQFTGTLRNELMRLEAERVGEVLIRCATRGRSWAYVAKALAREEATSAPRAGDFLPFSGEEAQTLPAVPETPSLPVSERVQLPLSGAGKATTAQAIWEASYQQLEFQLDPSSFATGVRGSVLVDFDPETRTLIVAARNELARALLVQRLARTIWRILSDVSGQPIELECLTREDWQQRMAHHATAAA